MITLTPFCCLRKKIIKIYIKKCNTSVLSFVILVDKIEQRGVIYWTIRY